MAGAGAGRPYKPTSVRIYLTVGVVSSRGVGGWYPTVPSNLAFFRYIPGGPSVPTLRGDRRSCNKAPPTVSA